MRKKYILVCEKGWRGIRELSLELAGKDIPSVVLIRGAVRREVRDMISRHKEIKNVFIPGRFFTLFLFVYILINLVLPSRKALAVYLNKEKTYKRLASLKSFFPRLELAKACD